MRPAHPLTPSGRVAFPPDIELIRQVPVSRPEAPAAFDWLMSGAGKQGGLAELLDGTMARLTAAGEPLQPLGDFSFHGVAEPVAIFSPLEEPAQA